MANDDEDAAPGTRGGRTPDGGRPNEPSLAGAIGEAIGAGSIEAALHAARAFQLRHPGDGDAKRVVEALELLMSQVWLGGDEDDARYADAAAYLNAADLAAARAGYTAILRADPTEERASRLALRVDVVRCAMAGAPLPRTDDDDEEPQPAVEYEDSTRVADDGELPLAAFADEEETVDGDPLIPPDAFPDEPTRQLALGDYELVESSSTESMSSTEPKETTRVAQPGELPLDQLRSQMRQEESDADLDLLLDEMGSEAPGAPAPPPPLELDIDDELEGEESHQPTEVAARERKRTPSRSFPRPKEEDLARPQRESPSRTFARPSSAELGEPVLAPPPMDDPIEAEPSGRHHRYDSSAPLPPSIPRADELPRDPAHAPIETGEVALPKPNVAWEIREPGGEGPPPGHGPLDSWTGVRVYETEPATFEPGSEGMDADSWEDATQVGEVTPQQEAEAAVARGDLGEALRIYQDLATESPDDQRLWDRVAEIARMLQQRSKD